jgi:hypothetical protein
MLPGITLSPDFLSFLGQNTCCILKLCFQVNMCISQANFTVVLHHILSSSTDKLCQHSYNILLLLDMTETY